MATEYMTPGSATGSDVECYPRGFFRRISWGAIFAGTVVALVVGLALGLLGLGIGLGTINPATQENPLGSIGTGAGIWMGISTLISLFIGGWVAGRLAAIPRSANGVLHGLVVWGVVTLFSFYLMTTTAGMLASGITNILGRGMAMMGGTFPTSPEQLGMTRGEAMQMTESAMSTLSKAAIWSFVAVVLGAIASAIGGAIGVPKDMQTPAGQAR